MTLPKEPIASDSGSWVKRLAVKWPRQHRPAWSVPIAGLLCLLLGAHRAAAIDTLVVGAGDYDWEAIQESAAFVSVAPESIWTWAAGPGANLAADLTARGGWIRVYIEPTNPFESPMKSRPGLDAWVDGDAATAWGPDEDPRVGREAALYIDLGGTFRVDQLRLYPRLDRAHRMSFPGSFQLATHDGVLDRPYSADLPLSLRYRSIVDFSPTFPNREPIVARWFPVRDVRFVRLVTEEVEPWEIAELEIRGDGTIPSGEFVSLPLYVRGGYPIWGRVTTDAGELEEQAISVYTRTGSDPEPLHYFLRFGDQVEKVSRAEWESAAQGASRGPVHPNPAWSQWQPVADGQVQSPSPSRYLQFRVLLREPGTRIDRLMFEHLKRPLASDLAAEIAPAVVVAGEQTAFTLSMEVHIDAVRGDAGFRYLEVITPAEVDGVDEVLLDDEAVLHTALIHRDRGFTLDLWERLLLPGSFVQVRFRGSVFRDGTPFRVRVMDYFPRDEEVEFVYQTARAEEVDGVPEGGDLVVRVRGGQAPLLRGEVDYPAVITPNGDGINDLLELDFSVNKLTSPAPLHVDILDLKGRRVRQVSEGEVRLGRQVRVWDGRDETGRLAPPGLYLYRLQVVGDHETVTRTGPVRVVY